MNIELSDWNGEYAPNRSKDKARGNCKIENHLVVRWELEAARLIAALPLLIL